MAPALAELRRRPWWLRPFTRREDLHCALFQLILLFGYGSAFWLYLNPQRIGATDPWSKLAFVLAAGLMLGWCSGINVGVNFHNAAHCPIFRRPWLNRWFERAWTVSGGWPSFFWKHSHTTVHHDNLLHDNDWTLPHRDEGGRFENPYLYAITHWPWRYAYHLFRDFRSGRGGPGVGRKALWELTIFAVLFSIPFFIDWKMALGLWVFPAFVGNVAVMGPGMYAQHAGCERKTALAPYKHSNCFVNDFFNLTMFNIGYHIEHHDHPTVHWSALPALHQKMKPEFIRTGAHVTPYGYYGAGHRLCQGVFLPEKDAEFRQQHPDYVAAEPERRVVPKPCSASQSKIVS